MIYGMKRFYLICTLFSALGVHSVQAAVSSEPPKASVSLSAPTHRSDKGSQVDINQASAEELAEALNGVGLKKAQSIVHYRQEFGPFKNLEQLLDVPGIGQSLIDRNRTRLKW